MLKESQPTPAVQQSVEKCGFCGTPGHNMMTCRKWKRMQELTATQGQTTKYCQNCRIQGHDTSECRSGPRTRRLPIQDGTPVCHHCNKRGHIRRNCFLLNGQGQQNANTQRQVRFHDNAGLNGNRPGAVQATQPQNNWQPRGPNAQIPWTQP